MWDGIEEVSNLQLTKLSVKNMDLSAVPVQALAKVAARAHTLDVSNTSLTPTLVRIKNLFDPFKLTPMLMRAGFRHFLFLKKAFL